MDVFQTLNLFPEAPIDDTSNSWLQVEGNLYTKRALAAFCLGGLVCCAKGTVAQSSAQLQSLIPHIKLEVVLKLLGMLNR